MAAGRKREKVRRIYCAGPLFNRVEQGEMTDIARTLEEAGFSTFLPHRDSFLFEEMHREFLRGGYASTEATRLIQQAIFCLDTYEVVSRCEGLVLNMNGRVPDEGAVVETAMAWMAGKSIVLYKSDSRSFIHGSDNPLVLGLGSFARVSTIPEIAFAFRQLYRSSRPSPKVSLPRMVKSAIEPGRRLEKLLATCSSPADLVPVIASLPRQMRR
ncbi:MAG TPA: nucleoside 2-deoxyribosyltransferase, partial [Candidatus Acidoferrum sp.]|nr:nucleoside 2-deoxyribosyltransferase [Candidatus Acidoferrum sp.]